jgi:gas vesicle protein
METGHIPQQPKNTTEEFKDKAKAGASQFAERAADAGSSAMQKASDVASNVGQKVQDTARNVGKSVQDTASRTVDRADQAISGVGQRMTSAAESLRQSAPREGMLGTAASTAADNLEAGGRYLQENGLGDMMEDFSTVIRNHPLPAFFIALGTGVMLGAAMRRR